MREVEVTSGGVFRSGKHLAAPDGPCCYCCYDAGEALWIAVRMLMGSGSLSALRNVPRKAFYSMLEVIIKRTWGELARDCMALSSGVGILAKGRPLERRSM